MQLTPRTGRLTGRSAGRILPSAGSLPQWQPQPGLERAEVRSQGLHPVSCRGGRGGRGPSPWAVFLCFPGALAGSWARSRAALQAGLTLPGGDLHAGDLARIFHCCPVVHPLANLLAISCVDFRCAHDCCRGVVPSFPEGPLLRACRCPCGRLGFPQGSAGPVAPGPGCCLRASCSICSGSRSPWRLGGAGLGWGHAEDPSPLRSRVPLPCLGLEQGARVAGLGSTLVPPSGARGIW